MVAAKKRSKAGGEARGGSQRAALRKAIINDPVGRRWAAVALSALLGWKASSVRQKVPGVTPSRLGAWEKALVSGKGLEFKRERVKAAILSPPALAAVQVALTSGGQGKRKQKSLRRAYPALLANATVDKSMEQVRVALKRANWAPQAIKKKLPHTAAIKRARVAFARKEGRIFASNTASTDSKYFQSEHTRGNGSGTVWAPVGSPIHRDSHQGSSIKAHVYGAVTRYGAPPLIAASGTSGGLSKLAQSGPMHPLAGIARSRSVNAQEYRFILDDGNGGGLLDGCDAIFRAANVPRWRLQQDGARPHTVANTPLGRLTRALITSKAALVEPWPARSPDLSPIEHAWSATEEHLHAHETWHDHASFLAALQRSWAAVVTPNYCRRLFGGLRNTYAACIAKGGAEVVGWGARAK